jgi:hypothetical protein
MYLSTRCLAALAEIGAPDLPQAAVSEPDGKIKAAQLDSLTSATISARTIPWIVVWGDASARMPRGKLSSQCVRWPQ